MRRRRDEEREQSAVRGADRRTDRCRAEAAPARNVRPLNLTLLRSMVQWASRQQALRCSSCRGRGPLDLEKLDLPSNHPFAVKRKVGPVMSSSSL